MFVRPLTVADAPTWHLLWREALADSPTVFGTSSEEEATRTPEQVRARFEHDGIHTVQFGAFDDQKLIGTVVYSRPVGSKKRHLANMGAMYVTPSARGQGVGHRLVTALLDHARNQPGLQQLRLGVTVGNTAARALYVRHGFVAWGIEPAYLRWQGQLYDVEHMWLALPDHTDAATP